MADAVRSEWLKLRTARANVVLLLLALVVPVLLTVLVTATVPLDELPDDTPANRFSLAVAGLGIGHTLLGVLGVLVIGSEFRHNTIRVTFSAIPRRLRVHAAKIVLVAVVSALVGLVAVASSYLVGSAILDARGFGVSLSDTGVTRSLAGAVLVAVLMGLVGLGVGTIVRATAGAITVIVVYPVIVEALLVRLRAQRRQVPAVRGGQRAAVARRHQGRAVAAGRRGHLHRLRGGPADRGRRTSDVTRRVKARTWSPARLNSPR